MAPTTGRRSASLDRVAPYRTHDVNAIHDSHAVSSDADEIWSLRLYVAGQSPKSLRALANLNSLCEQHLAGRHEIEIIDLVEHPSLAQSDDILAIPTLVRRLPPPPHKIIGDLSDTQHVLTGLRLHPQPSR